MLDRHRVDAVRDRARRGWSINAIVRVLGVSRKAVRRYLRVPHAPSVQVRLRNRRFDEAAQTEVRQLFGAADENASEVHRLLAARGGTVSVRTVQRAVAGLRGRRDTVAGSTPSTAQALTSAKADLELVRRVAGNFRTCDRDELESELTEYLVILEPYRAIAENWTAYLFDALTKHAGRWLGNQQRKGGTAASPHAYPSAGEGDTGEQGDLIRFANPNIVDRVALATARRSLDAWLARVWDAYIASGFNQTLTAIILDVHRNTVARALARIRQVLKRHGF